MQVQLPILLMLSTTAAAAAGAWKFKYQLITINSFCIFYSKCKMQESSSSKERDSYHEKTPNKCQHQLESRASNRFNVASANIQKQSKSENPNIYSFILIIVDEAQSSSFFYDFLMNF